MSLYMGRVGRKKGFVLAAGLLAAGGLLGVFAMILQHFILLCIAHFVMGAAFVGINFLRFAAAEVVPRRWTSNAISYTLASGLIAAFIGPEVFSATKDMLPSGAYAGAYAAIAALGVRHIAATLHEADPSVIAGLGPGDILFIDSSHILMPGTDVDYLLNDVWPSLPAGVLVPIHDILLPDGYPDIWSWRGYNEQSAVAPLLTGGAANLRFASHYAATRMTAAVAATVAARLPLIDGAFETSLWIEKN